MCWTKWSPLMQPRSNESTHHAVAGCLIAITCVVATVLIVILTVRSVYSETRMGPTPICGVPSPFYESVASDSGSVDSSRLYANIKGSGTLSLRAISTNEPYMCERLLRNYAYVPGLRGDDPTDLVMLYMKRKTWYYWHGYSKPFAAPMWLVFSPGFGYCESNAVGCAESGQRMDTQEFTRRLRHTLEFLRKNDRPYWTNVVVEQEAFLSSIEKEAEQRPAPDR